VEVYTMPTNLALDDKLVEEARKLGDHGTKREAVNQALREYVSRLRQREVLELFGTMDIEPRYDHKRERGRR
jgi:Arc/MetJ family transcription regulator